MSWAVAVEEKPRTPIIQELCQVITEKRTEAASSRWKHLVAGGIAGALSRTCTAPLDRLKIALQVLEPDQTLRIKPVLNSMLSEGGVLSLWRGNGMNVCKVIPETAFKFTFYEEIKQIMIYCREDPELTVVDRMIAGGMAGFASQTLIYPLEVMKTRLALRKTNQSGWSCVQDIFHQGGRSPKAFFLGYIPNAIGIVPYAGIDLAVYETLKKKYMVWSGKDGKPNNMALLGCGVLSSLLGQTITYPLNLVKTRMQASLVTADSPRLTMYQSFVKIIELHGVLGLYRGLLPNLMKVAPAVAIIYMVYEQTRHFLDAPMS